MRFGHSPRLVSVNGLCGYLPTKEVRDDKVRTGARRRDDDPWKLRNAHTGITSMIARHGGHERMTELEYCRPADPAVVGMLLLIAVDLLAGARGFRTARFSDLTEYEVNAVAEEAKRVWEAGQAEGMARPELGRWCGDRVRAARQNVAANGRSIGRRQPDCSACRAS